jgi:hypothetical protein
MRNLAFLLIALFGLSMPLYAADENTSADNGWSQIELAGGLKADVQVIPNFLGDRIILKVQNYAITLTVYNPSLAFNITEGYETNLFKPNAITLWGNEITDEQQDTSYLPPSYLRAWSFLQSVSSQLIRSDSFWDLISDDNGDKRRDQNLRTGLQAMAEGRYTPSMGSSEFTIRLNSEGDILFAAPAGRAYTLIYGDNMIMISTSSAYPAANLDMYLGVLGNDYGEKWTIHLDPKTHKCEVTNESSEQGELIPDSVEILNMTTDVGNQLSLLQQMVPEIAEKGFLFSNDDVKEDILGLIKAAIEDLATYEIVQVETESP